jgi:hypothetical protein
MTCLSGGASGADTFFGTEAAVQGHQVVHWSFDGHKSPLPEEERVILSNEQLEVANTFLKRASKKLKRNVPWKKPSILKLLQRNYYQVRYTDQVIAVGRLNPFVAPVMGIMRFHTWDDKNRNDNQIITNTPGYTGIQGGTAWACQMYIDMAADPNINTGSRTFHLTFFDQVDEKYYRWNFNEQAWEHYPLTKSFPMVWQRSTKVYTGIGTRELTEWGKISILSAFGELKRQLG